MKKLFSFRTIRTAAIVFIAGVAMCFMSQAASAQGCGYGGGGWGYGGGGWGYGGGALSVNVNRGYGGYGGVGISLYRPPTYRRPPVWHDTSHYDYYPGRYVRHGNHFDYIPGHSHLHRTGHWHR